MKNFIGKILLLLFLLTTGAICNSVHADESATLDEPYVVTGLTFSWNESERSHVIPASAFVASANHAEIKVEGLSNTEILLKIGENQIYKAEWGSTEAYYVLEGTELESAKAGELVMYATSTPTSITVTSTYINPYGNQNDTDGDGVLEPTDEKPAFGALVDEVRYPQKSNVPTIYITTDESEDVTELYETKTETYYKANIVVVDKYGTMKQRNEAVTFRGRGNSTWMSNSKKKPWRLKFPQKTKFLAEQDENHNEINNHANNKSWVLMCNVYDKSLIRNALTAELGNYCGLEFNPSYKFVDLVINGTYLGTYQVTDQMNVDSKRINVNSSTGWFMEHSTNIFAEDPYILPQAGTQNLYVTVKNPDTEIVTESGETTEAEEGGQFYEMKQWLTKYWTALNNCEYSYTDANDKFMEWRSMTDMNSLIGWMIVEDLAGNYDGAMANIYTYKEADAPKLKFGPLWDLDIAYGNYQTLDNMHFYSAQVQGIGFLFEKMLTDPYFVKLYYEKWKKLYNGGEIVTFVNETVDKLAASVAETQALNYDTTGDSFRSGDYAWSITATAGLLGKKEESYDAAVQGIKDYVASRAKWLDSEYSSWYESLGSANLTDKYTVYLTASDGGSVTGAGTFEEGTQVTITATADDDYEFVKWSDGNTDATRTITIDGDIELTATFAVPADIFNERGEHKQLTNLPTIYITADEISNTWSASTLEVYDAEDLLHSTSWKALTPSIQYQGSGAGGKDSYRLKFDKKTNVLGNNSYKQWVLLANDDDPSMVNNALSKVMGDALGMTWTPDYQFVDLYVNGKYQGTYQMTDRVKAEDGRSLVSGGDKDSDWQVRFNSLDELKEDGTTDYIDATATTPYIIVRNPDPDDLTAETYATLKTTMADYFSNTFFATDDDGNYSNVASNVNQEQLINWYIGQEILNVYKGFSSIEAYRSVTAADQNLYFGPYWDSEKAFGNYGEADPASMKDINDNSTATGLMINYAADETMKTFFSNLWKQAWFANGVRTKWESIYGDNKTVDLQSLLVNNATAIAATLEQSQALNAQKWDGSLGDYTSYSDAVAAISTYLDERMPYLDAKFSVLASNVLGCDEHKYSDEFTYEKQSDGTYRRAYTCNVCGTQRLEDEVYYQFTVYPESSKTQTIYAQSWTPDEATPNAIAVVELKQAVVEKIDGYNIVCGKKNSAGNLTCKDLRLTDGHPYYSDNKFIATSATYSRTVSNDWGTMILPYKYQKAETDDAKFYHISSMTQNDEGVYVMKLKSIEPDVDSNASAYTPVLFKRTNDDVTTVTVTGTDITVKKSSADKSKSTVEGWTLYGVMEEDEITANNDLYFYIHDNKFWKSTSSFTVKPFRAYLKYTGTDDVSAASKGIIIAVDGDSATGVQEVNATDAVSDAPVYDILGRRVKTLQRNQLYIKAGQKFIYKP